MLLCPESRVGLSSPPVASHNGLVDEFASGEAESLASAAWQATGALLVLLQLTLALPAGFTRGQAVKKENEFYSCEKYAECRDDPVEAAAYNPHRPEYCKTHELPMKTLVNKQSS